MKFTDSEKKRFNIVKKKSYIDSFYFVGIVIILAMFFLAVVFGWAI